MSAVDVLLQLEAAYSGNAQPRTTLRHRHLDEQPMVVVAYKLAGEAAAPLGILYGTDPRAPRLLVAPEPRSRAIRFREVFNPFAADLCDYVDGRSRHIATEGRREIAAAAPQLIFPNNATLDFVGNVFGRSLRYLKTDGDFPVPEPTVRAGAHLTWLAMRVEVPGSCVLLSATDLLRRHWSSGLSDLESEDLHVQLAWVDPPAGMSGSDAADEAEELRLDGTLPAAGPASDPVWDRDTLEPLIETFNDVRGRDEDEATVARLGVDIRAAVEAALAPTWAGTWRAIDLVRTLPEAASVSDRWKDDRADFARHAHRVDTGAARFRTRDSVKQSAFMVSQRERAQSSLEASEALDDSLVMAGLLADGQALTGKVVSVNRPFVTVELDESCQVPVGTELFWTEMPSKCSVIVVAASDEAPFIVTLETHKGKTKYYPTIGKSVLYSPFNNGWVPPPSLPNTVPWTHAGAAGDAPEPEVPV